jgi:8-oxo-dGTP diphosphatase
MVEADEMANALQREFPGAPIVGVGAVVVDRERVLLVQRGHEPAKGKWSLPGGILELGESLVQGVVREVEEESGLAVEAIELIELIDRVDRVSGAAGERVRYHFVIADYLCRVVGGELKAGSDAEAVRWVERAEWKNDLALDPITVRVIEAGWERARTLARAVQEPR